MTGLRSPLCLRVIYSSMLAAFAAMPLALLVPVSAQDAGTTALAYPLYLTREQAIARVTAINERLPYVPGELLVKFKPGFGAREQTRALSVLRGGIQAEHSRWIGEMLYIRTASEPNAEAAANILV